MPATRDDAHLLNPDIVDDYGSRGGSARRGKRGRRARARTVVPGGGAAPVLRRALRERGLWRRPRQLPRRVQVVRAVPLDQRARGVHVQQPVGGG